MIKFTSNYTTTTTSMNESLKVRNATKQDTKYMGFEASLPSGKPAQWAEWEGKDDASILVICSQSDMDDVIFVTIDLFDGESDESTQYVTEFDIDEETQALKKFDEVIKLLNKNPEKYAYGAGENNIIKLGFNRTH